MIPDEIANKILEKKIPIDVQFELTWRCNQRCRHCYQYPACGDELTTAGIKDVISQLAEAGTLYLSFTGGEPLLRKDFWEIAGFARKKHFALLLQTNATLIDRAAADKIAELNFFNIHISLLGANMQTHDYITQLAGSFKKTLKAIKLLQERKVRVTLNVTLMQENFNEYPGIKRLKDRLGNDIGIRVSPYMFAKNDGGTEPEALRLDDGQLREFYLAMRKESEESFTAARGITCNFGQTLCTINARGEVYPCVAVPLISGNLKNDKFSDIWENNPVLKKIRDTEAADLKKCAECRVKNWCFRCSGFSYLENRDLFGCSSECSRFANIIKEVNSHEETKI